MQKCCISCISRITFQGIIAFRLFLLLNNSLHIYLLFLLFLFKYVALILLTDTIDRFLGIILLLEFILFDCLRLFFIFLTGRFGLLTLSSANLAQNMLYTSPYLIFVTGTTKNLSCGEISNLLSPSTSSLPYLSSSSTLGLLYNSTSWSFEKSSSESLCWPEEESYGTSFKLIKINLIFLTPS